MRREWKPVAAAACLVPLVLLLYAREAVNILKTGHGQPVVLGGARLLRFDVCEGFAEQRLALMYGFLLAKLSNRTAILPRLLVDTSQDPAGRAASSRHLHFSDVYDLDRFQAAINGSIEVLDAHVANSKRIPMLSNPWDAVTSTEALVDVQCPLPGVPPDILSKHEDLAWQILDALQPSRLVEGLVDQAAKRMGIDGAYTLLHLLSDQSWKDECAELHNRATNCYGNTVVVGTVLQSLDVSFNETLVVAAPSGREGRDTVIALANLRSNHYHPKWLTYSRVVPHEVQDAMRYFLGMRASKFVGNSYNTFSAMLIMERRRKGLWAAQYNGGLIPLEETVPLFKLAWVFTYNDYSNIYDDMLQAAVRSAKAAQLKPYCLFYGNETAPITQWLLEQGVTILHHEPAWIDDFLEVARAGSQEHQRHSHLFSNASSLIGTYQRIDIPLAPELQQYEYVLFTDCDVYFRRPFRLTSFPHPLPPYAAMAVEMADMFPYNAGVMLMNLPGLRRTYEHFLSFILDNQYGAMVFPGFGPGDQGAYNQFYEASVRHHKLPEVWNAKPYKPFDETAYIVHFHGPKPVHYKMWMTEHTCSFDNMCELGFQNGLCDYMDEYKRFFSGAPTCPERRH
jgi:hypothetical protein